MFLLALNIAGLVVSVHVHLGVPNNSTFPSQSIKPHVVCFQILVAYTSWEEGAVAFGHRETSVEFERRRRQPFSHPPSPPSAPAFVITAGSFSERLAGGTGRTGRTALAQGKTKDFSP